VAERWRKHGGGGGSAAAGRRRRQHSARHRRRRHNQQSNKIFGVNGVGNGVDDSDNDDDKNEGLLVDARYSPRWGDDREQEGG
jgi:hypothetical protein